MNRINSNIVLFVLLALASTDVLAKKSEKSSKSVKKAIEVLQADVATLFDEVAALNFTSVSVDCSDDPGSLQAAIDSSSASGAVISVTGQCNPTQIVGKSNLAIDGGGSGSIIGSSGDPAALHVSASQNIVVNGMQITANGSNQALSSVGSTLFIYESSFDGGVVSSLDINHGSSAAVANLAINASGNAAFTIENNASVTSEGSLSINNSNNNGFSLEVRSNSLFTQTDGELALTGKLNAEHGSIILIKNGELSASGIVAVVSRNSNLRLRPSGSADEIVVNGSLQAFSSSNIDVGGGDGHVSLTGNDVLIQRNSSMMVNAVTFTGTVDVSYGRLRARQNAVLDFLNVNFVTTPIIQLILGSGMRLLNQNPLTASCDSSAWTNFDVSCAP